MDDWECYSHVTNRILGISIDSFNLDNKMHMNLKTVSNMIHKPLALPNNGFLNRNSSVISSTEPDLTLL